VSPFEFFKIPKISPHHVPPTDADVSVRVFPLRLTAYRFL
jgi:hypothetical protein